MVILLSVQGRDTSSTETLGRILRRKKFYPVSHQSNRTLVSKPGKVITRKENHESIAFRDVAGEILNK